MFDPKRLKNRQSPWRECLSHFPIIKTIIWCSISDDDNEVGKTKKWEHNLHGACTRLREVRKS